MCPSVPTLVSRVVQWSRPQTSGGTYPHRFRTATFNCGTTRDLNCRHAAAQDTHTYIQVASPFSLHYRHGHSRHAQEAGIHGADSRCSRSRVARRFVGHDGHRRVPAPACCLEAPADETSFLFALGSAGARCVASAAKKGRGCAPCQVAVWEEEQERGEGGGKARSSSAEGEVFSQVNRTVQPARGQSAAAGVERVVCEGVKAGCLAEASFQPDFQTASCVVAVVVWRASLLVPSGEEHGQFV